MDFISLTGYELHREYLRTQKLKMSIFEKSYPELVGKSCREILKTSIKRSEREEAAALLADIRAHEIYFDSFSSQNLRSQRIRQSYGSEANFLYQLTCLAEKCSGFVFVLTALSVVLQVASFKLFHKRVFKMSPIHHHFQQMGYSETKISYAYFTLTVMLSIACFAFLV